MSNLVLRRTGTKSAEIVVSVCRLGDFITAGESSLVSIKVVDNPVVRALCANLYGLKSKKFNGLVSISVMPCRKYSMDQSIWYDLADALFAFTLCIDAESLCA